MATPKVLIVDDDRDLLELLRRKLTAGGFEVTTAEDGLSATGMARRQRPDVVLLDVGLPGGDGFTVFERLRKLVPVATTPIIVVSACPPATGERFLGQGAQAFVAKPVNPNELIETIHRVLERGRPAAR